MEFIALFIIAIIVALVLTVVLLFILRVVLSAIRYFYEETIHNVRNFKRAIRDFVWEVEWKWNHR